MIRGARHAAAALNDADDHEVVGRIDPEPRAGNAPPPVTALADLPLRRIGIEDDREVVAKALAGEKCAWPIPEFELSASSLSTLVRIMSTVLFLRSRLPFEFAAVQQHLREAEVVGGRRIETAAAGRQPRHRRDRRIARLGRERAP